MLQLYEFFTKYNCEYDNCSEEYSLKLYKTKNIIDEKTKNVIKLIDIFLISLINFTDESVKNLILLYLFQFLSYYFCFFILIITSYINNDEP